MLSVSSAIGDRRGAGERELRPHAGVAGAVALQAAAPARPETVGAALVRLLAELGTEQVFGIPGVHTLELFRGIAASGLAHVLNRSEQGAVFAADGYARVTGRPGVALLISGPGVTNAATAVAQAYHDSIPLLTVSATPPAASLGGDRGTLHEMPDQHAFMASITALSRHVEDPEELPQVLASAHELFGGGRPRPVHIQVPSDVLERPAPSQLRVGPPAPAPPQPPPEALRHIAGLLARALRPLIILGGGAAGAGAEARRLADVLDAPVVLTLNAKGALPDEHPLCLGTTLSTAATLALIRGADVVLAVGTELSEIDYYYAEQPLRFDGALVRVDLDPRQLQAGYPASAALQADAGAAMRLLAAELRGLQRTTGRESGAAVVAQLRTRIAWWPEADALADVVRAIGAALPPDALVALEANQLAYVGQQLWPASRPRSWMIPAGWATLGCALPMAIGASVAWPERPAVAVVGDGGLLFTVGELACACQYELPVTALLWNNGGYGEMRHQMDRAGMRHLATAGSAHDFASIATGFGWAVSRARRLEEVPETVASAAAARRPTLVELVAEDLS